MLFSGKFMSYAKMQELLLQEIMRRAQIPGVSIAYINSDGAISTPVKGLTDGCGLFKMSNDPTKHPFNKLGLGSKNAVVSFNNDLYYVDQTKQTVHKIELTDDNKIAFEKLHASCTNTYKLADGDDHALIASLTGRDPPTDVKPETVFGAASLSKPVFAYLVQKLIKANADNNEELLLGKFTLPDGTTDFDLDTPLSKILPLEEFNKEFASDESALASANELLTARMVLSHMTGLDHHEMKFQFQPEKPEPGVPGKGHGYSNTGILYLQKVIEKLTNSNIETLARKHVFEPCDMTTSSTFGVGRILLSKKEPLLEEMKSSELVILQKDGQLTAYWIENEKLTSHTIAANEVQDIVNMLPEEGSASENADLIIAVTSKFGCPQLEPTAPNSLRTTAKDYANFVKHLINDSTVENPFAPHVFMTEDKGLTGAIGVAKGKIGDTDLNHVAWGLGWGLQTDDKGNATTAYHSGDMNDYRAWVAVNLKDKSAVVFFANSHNGHILAEQIIPSTIQIEHAANYFFPKWGFATNLAQLGGKTNSWGLKPEPSLSVSVEQQQSDKEEKKEIEKLDTPEKEISVSEEVEQTYKKVQNENQNLNEIDEEEASQEKTFNPSPLSNTLKPN